MSTTHGQPGLSSDQRSTIRSTILSTRHTLEDELRRQLEKYGIYENKRLPFEDLSHLSAEERHKRRTLDAAIERELESTEGDLERSITNYVREATKTYLNRFVALKTIEVRGLVEETITERPEYGNRSYMHHTVAEIAGEVTNAPDDGFGAALDLAYQEIGAEIRMIFEESEHTAIDLDAQVREEVLDELDKIDDDAWESDEALGWVYQYFGEEEREEIDDRVDVENYKIAGTDIATKTQLFTPRYIVEWMVDNSLGRTWLEMQGERTNIDDEENCFYLAPLEDSLIDRERKAVEDITVLDPACGSGHMLFYAFDVLYQMYLEEGEIPEEYIPREILRNNLYGIDIDSGAAQIAALSLYLKAKEKSPNVAIPQLNIVSADAVLINGENKQEVLDRAHSELEKEILEQIWTSFDHIRELGSLVQIEDRIDDLLDAHREKFESKGQTQFTEGGGLTEQSTFVSGSEEETWEELKNRLMKNVHEMAQSALDRDDQVEEMFAGEVEKTVELLDILRNNYEVVVTNPPYLQSSKMGDTIKKYVRSNYTGKRDLYASFIERCSSFAHTRGYYSIVTPQSYMYTYSYRGLRKEILSSDTIAEMVHSTSMIVGSEETAMAVYQCGTRDNDYLSRFLRETGVDAKPEHLHKSILKLRNGDPVPNEYRVNQSAFLEIGRQPYLYYFGKEALNLFTNYPSVDDVAEVKQGLATGDDDRFVRKWWEVPQSEIDSRYRRYQKSGTSSEYYDYAEDYIDWKDGGQPIKDYNGSRPQNQDYYFTPGITYRGFGNYLVARLQTDEMLFYHKSHFVTSNQISSELLLANFNSTIHRFIANGLNPGPNFEIGDGKRFPIKQDYESEETLEDLVEIGVTQRKRISSLTETSSDYDPNLMSKIIEKGPKSLCYALDKCNAEILMVHGIIDRILFEEYDISEETRKHMSSDLPKNVSQYPAMTEHLMHHSEVIGDYLTDDIADPKTDKIVDLLTNSTESDLGELALKTEISPLSLAEIRREYELYTDEEAKQAVGQAISFIIGSMFGRWKSEDGIKTSNSEIIPFGMDARNDMESLLEDGLEKIFDQPYEIQEEMAKILGKSPTEWIRNNFFRNHHVDEYKPRGERSPIYWQLESPDGAFSCFVYYHNIDENTLPKLRGQYLDPRINELKNELDTLNAQTSGEDPDKGLLNRKEEVQNDLEDVREFRETIDQMIDDGVTVDVEKGIWENIKEWDQYEVLETGLPKLKSSYSR